MIQLIVAAPHSGSGKTAVTCALLRAMRRRGLRPCAFKVGPDYLDPTFHRAVLGAQSHNLDLFLSDETCVRTLYARGCAGHGAAVAEGVMGCYDGLGGVSERASTWHAADALGLPILLVADARGASLTLAAEIKGLAEFRESSHIAGVLLNRCPQRLYEMLAPTLERESAVPVLGYLPPMEAARIASRHLGLYAAEEIEDLHTRLDTLSDALRLDWERFSAIFDRTPPEYISEEAQPKRARIAVASDAAFAFAYAETLEVLERCGAELVPFSPLADAALPERIGGLYLPGGYPELHAAALAANETMRASVRTAVEGGMPTVAECGGFLYLGETLCDDKGNEYPMAGVLPGRAADAGRLVRFGYATLCAESDSLLFRAGEQIPAHEFHHWDSDACGDGLRVEKNGKSRRCGFVSDTLYAAFPHLYLAGRPALAERFVAAAEQYGEAHGSA